MNDFIKQNIQSSNDRLTFWVQFINEMKCVNVAEIGVYRGEYAEHVLKNCDSIDKYYMIDPWKHLDDWNKPANKDDEVFNEFYAEVIKRTNFANKKRIVLRGKTTEVINDIPDNSLDFVYIDGDHTLKGIAIDLINIYPKIKDGGWIAGDDFTQSIWQHPKKFEPTMIFPFAIYFAEAMSDHIYSIGHSQFLIRKDGQSNYEFTNFTSNYADISLRNQFCK